LENQVSTQRFHTTIEETGNRCYISIPFDPNEVWGAKQKHHVSGSIDEAPIRGPIDTDGSPVLWLGPGWLRDSEIKAGRTVEVVLAPEGPLSGTVEPDLAAALREDLEAQDFFDSLPTFYRNNYVRWIESAKRPETRAKRITEMMGLLKEGKRER
jgi:hypothetical protein